MPYPNYDIKGSSGRTRLFYDAVPENQREAFNAELAAAYADVYHRRVPGKRVVMLKCVIEPEVLKGQYRTSDNVQIRFLVPKASVPDRAPIDPISAQLRLNHAGEVAAEFSPYSPDDPDQSTIYEVEGVVPDEPPSRAARTSVA